MIHLRGIILLVKAWFTGWVGYACALFFLYNENPLQKDVFALGVWSFFVGSIYCLVIILPFLLLLRRWLKEKLTNFVCGFLAAGFGICFMGFLIGWVFEEEVILFQIHAGLMSFVYGYGFLAVLEARLENKSGEIKYK